MPVDREALAAAALEAVPAGLVSLYLFGSEALGRAHRDSDVDIPVLLDPRRYRTRAERFDVRLVLDGRLGAVIGGHRIADVVVLNDAPPHLVRRVMTEGHRFYCADPEQDHGARRTSSRSSGACAGSSWRAWRRDISG